MSVSVGAAHLFGNELALMTDVFRRGFKRYLEFGIGGSTLMAVQNSFESIVAVDFDMSWVSAVRSEPDVAKAISAGRASILHGDIGPICEWGNPVDTGSISRWPNYIAVAWEEWGRRSSLPDLIYIDGRFRVACAYSVAAILARDNKSGKSIVLMHDFSIERPSYKDVLKYFEIVEQEGSLVALRLGADVNPTAALADLLLRQFDFG